jgi:hypothetical protein
VSPDATPHTLSPLSAECVLDVILPQCRDDIAEMVDVRDGSDQATSALPDTAIKPPER